MTNPEMDRVRQRLEHRLAEVSEHLHKLEAKNAEQLEKWQQAREAALENEAGAGQLSEPFEPEPDESEASDEDEIRIEAKLSTSALLEQLELARPKSMENRGVQFHGR
jgi:hypothetical protein